MGAAECVAFLEQLALNFSGRHVFVIWDGLGTHRSKKVQAWISKHRRLELLNLPPYAPELNPIEYGWGHVKSHQLANLTTESEADLFVHAKAAISRLCIRPDFLCPFLCHAPINFFPD